MAAAAVLAAMGSGAADADVMGVFSSGVLVSRVIPNGVGDTTAVALTTAGSDVCPFTSDGNPVHSGTVYWTFFDLNSNHITDGSFPMTNNDVYSFVWADESGVGLEGREGYLLFVMDQNNHGQLENDESLDCLTGEAFHVVAADNDVAFKPVWPVPDADFAALPVDLATLGPTSQTPLAAGSGFGSDFTRLSLRYSIANGGTTQIVVWSADAVGGPGVVYTVNIYDDEENRKSVNFALPNAEENTIDPATIVGRPTDFVNGFIEWRTPDDGNGDYIDNGADGNGIVSYSVIRSAAFSARQTILNSHFFDAIP